MSCCCSRCYWRCYFSNPLLSQRLMARNYTCLNVPFRHKADQSVQKTGPRARFCLHTKKALRTQSAILQHRFDLPDRARASSGKVQLDQCCCRGTKSPRGMSVRFRGSNHPARQTTDSHRPPAFASTGKRNTPPRTRRRRYGRNSCCDSAAVRLEDPTPLFQRGGFKGFHVFNGLLNAVPVHIQQRGAQ